MIYIELFLTFLQVGAFSFGGGYAMIALIQELVISHGWMTQEEVLNVVAVAESTPGPIAVNMATFVGAEEGGIFGSLVATLGVVLPSFCIILLIATLMKNLLKYQGVKAFLMGVRPCIVALILGTGITLFLSTLLNFKAIGASQISPDYVGIVIFAVLVVIGMIYSKLKKKKISPIIMILISAGLGMLLYSIT